MPNSISVKSDLFRFISLRNTQLIDPIKKDLIAVEHPDPSKSHFIKNLENKSLEEARELLQERTKTFNRIIRPKDLHLSYPKIYRFSHWLLKNKKQLKVKRLKEEADKLNALPISEQTKIWDHLFNQLLVGRNPSLRQTCSSLLIANHFIQISSKPDILDYAKLFYESHPKINSDEDYESRLLKRLANSKVLIPVYFSNQKQDRSSQKPQKQSEESQKPYKPKVNNDLLLLANNATKANKKLGRLNRAKKELKTHRLNPNLRNKRIDEILKNNDGSISSESRETLELLNMPESDLLSMYKHINQDIISTNRIYRDNNQGINSLKDKDIDDYCHLVHFSPGDIFSKLTLTIKVPNEGISIQRNTLILTIDGKSTIDNIILENIDKNSSLKTYTLRSHSRINLSGDNKISITGKVILNNNVKVEISAELSSKDNQKFGCSGVSTKQEHKETIEGPELYGVNNIGMGIFRRVEQEVCCYVPGEVSHIENIMAREYKERSTRNFTSTEDTVEISTENQYETNSDTSSTTRNEMHTAVAEVLSKGLSIGVGASAGVEGKTPNGEYSANANFGLALANASSTSDSEAQIYAEEVTRNASEKVLTKVSEKRTSKIIKEFEEKIRHGYDNREGDQHVTGIYRWIDIIYKNRLINYGNMEMVEFLIPEPARFYKETILGKKEEIKPEESGSTPNENQLMSLSDRGINSPEDILPVKPSMTIGHSKFYLDLSSYYGVTLPQPPQPDQVKNIIINKSNLDFKTPDTQRGSEYIDEEYRLTNVRTTGKFTYNPGDKDKRPARFTITVAGKQWHHEENPGDKGTQTFDYNIPNTSKTNFDVSGFMNGNIEAVISVESTISYNVNIKLTADLTDEALFDWQLQVYEMLESSYDQYLDQQSAQQDQEESKEEEAYEKLATGNTALNRRVEIRELKRAAIEMITRPFGKQIGKDFLRYGDCDVPYPNQSKAWEEYSSNVKFFEQAFEWDIMAYLFYPYFWAKRCDWKDLLKAENSIDHTFESFLQSGMARMVVPIRKGFERAVNFYMETGEVWNGGDLVFDSEDDLYLSIDEELEEPESFIEEEWETRVPTTLTLIQGDSAFLKGEGLPCCNELNQGSESDIQKSTALLGVLKE